MFRFSMRLYRGAEYAGCDSVVGLIGDPYSNAYNYHVLDILQLIIIYVVNEIIIIKDKVKISIN